MTKSGLIEAVAARMPHLAQRDLEVVVNTMFDAMTHALAMGDRIEIRGFGSFSVRHRRSRQGRNPKTGELIDVPAKRVPFFTVGHELKERVNDGFLREQGLLPEGASSASAGAAGSGSSGGASAQDSPMSGAPQAEGSSEERAGVDTDFSG